MAEQGNTRLWQIVSCVSTTLFCAAMIGLITFAGAFQAALTTVNANDKRLTKVEDCLAAHELRQAQSLETLARKLGSIDTKLEILTDGRSNNKRAGATPGGPIGG